MAKKNKVKDFFGTNRRELRLNDFHVLMTRGEEKRIKLAIEMPISGKASVAMPSWIANPWVEMEKADSLTARSNIEVMLEGMTLEVFSTEKNKRKTFAATGAMLTGFHLVTTGEGEKKQTSLKFVIYVPGNVQVRDWAWDHLHATFYAAFEYSQTEMDFDGEDDEDEDDDNEEIAAAGAEDDEDGEYVGGNENFNPREIRAAARPH